MQEAAHVFFGLDSFLEIGNGIVFRVVLIYPLFPLSLIATHGVRQVAEESERVLTKVVARERNHVEPDLVAHPVEGFGAFALDIEGRTSLEEDIDVLVGEFLSSDQYLEADHQDICDLVAFKEATVDVLVDVEG